MTDNERNSGFSRRDFLKTTTGAAAGMALVLVSGDLSLVSANSVTPRGGGREGYAYDPTRHSYIYLIDVSACIGCGSCVRACERENQVPKHFFRTWVERYHVSRITRLDVLLPIGYDIEKPSELSKRQVLCGFPRQARCEGMQRVTSCLDDTLNIIRVFR